jgi:cardiolipin synthase A/B
MFQVLTWGFVLSGWAIAAAGFFILPPRRRVPEAWAWLAIMFALPWVGPAAYLVLAENPLGRRRIVQYLQVISNLKSPDTVEAISQHTAVHTLDESAAAIERVAEAGGALPALGGNSARLVDDSEAIVESLVRDIDAAQRHVNLAMYIFLDDGTGRRVADALTRAARDRKSVV